VQKQTHLAEVASPREITKRSQMIEQNQGFPSSAYLLAASKTVKANPLMAILTGVV